MTLRKILNSIYLWYPKTPFFYGWLILAVSGIGAFIATSVAQTVFGGIQDLIWMEMNWDRKTIALAATLGTWTSGLTMPFIGKLVDRFGPRWMMLAASILVGAGSIYLSESKTIWQFFFCYIVVRSIAGPNLQNLIPRTVAVNFFQKRRNFAMGITAFNRIAGESINLQIITMVSSSFSWRTAYRTLGAIALPLSIPIFLLIRHKPEDVGDFPDGKSPVPETGESVNKNDRIWTFQEIISLPSFWFIMIAEFVAVTSTSMIIFQLVPFLTDGGMTQMAAAAALTTGNLLAGISVPGWGFLTDKFTTKRIAIIIICLALIPTTLFLFIPSGLVSFILVITWTVITGVVFVMGSMMLGTVFSRSSFGTVTGITGPTRTAAMGLGPTLGAFIISSTNSYNPVFIAAILGYFVVVFLYSSVRTESSPL